LLFYDINLSIIIKSFMDIIPKLKLRKKSSNGLSNIVCSNLKYGFISISNY